MNNEMLLHVQTDDDGNLVGFSNFSEILNRKNLYYIENPLDLPQDIGVGWRRVGDEWLPPLPPTESETLQKKLDEINGELWQLFQQSQFEDFLGVGSRESIKPTSNTNNTDSQSQKNALVSKRDEIMARLEEVEE